MTGPFSKYEKRFANPKYRIPRHIQHPEWLDAAFPDAKVTELHLTTGDYLCVSFPHIPRSGIVIFNPSVGGDRGKQEAKRCIRRAQRRMMWDEARDDRHLHPKQRE